MCVYIVQIMFIDDTPQTVTDADVFFLIFPSAPSLSLALPVENAALNQIRGPPFPLLLHSPPKFLNY